MQSVHRWSSGSAVIQTGFNKKRYIHMYQYGYISHSFSKEVPCTCTHTLLYVRDRCSERRNKNMYMDFGFWCVYFNRIQTHLSEITRLLNDFQMTNQCCVSVSAFQQHVCPHFSRHKLQIKYRHSSSSFMNTCKYCCTPWNDWNIESKYCKYHCKLFIFCKYLSIRAFNLSFVLLLFKLGS